MTNRKVKLVKLLVIVTFLNMILLHLYLKQKVVKNKLNNDYVTVVSIYFRLHNNKRHNIKDYDIWINNFIMSLGSPLVIFCDKESSERIGRYRKDLKIIFKVYESIWDLMKVLETYRNMSYVDNYWNRQYELDPDKHRYIHNSNLYAIWSLKPLILKLVSDSNPFNSDYFIYSDSGAWRQGIIEDWPDLELIKEIQKIQNNRILFGQVSNKISNLIQDNLIQGGIISGNQIAITNFYNNYYSIHDTRLTQGLFAAREEVLMNLIAFKNYNDTVIKLRTWGLKCNKTYKPWLFYQYFFANANFYFCFDNKISLLSL